MSAYKTLICTFKDKETLVDSLINLGWKPMVDQPQKLRGYRNDLRDISADIIVTKDQLSAASNDLGFKFDPALNEFLMICSDYDCKIGISDKVKQSYAITAVKKALSKNKFTIKEEIKNSNKSVVLTAGKII